MEDMSHMDSIRMKQLVEENQKLKRELDIQRNQKESFMRALMNNAKGETERLLSDENEKLKREIADLKIQLSATNRMKQEIERLNSTIGDLEERLSILTKGRNWKAAVNQNIAKSMETSSQALCYAVKGCSVREIVEKLDNEVTERTVYRAISVKADTDLQRITTIFHQYREVFDGHSVTEEDVMKWYDALRDKKLRRVARAKKVQYEEEW